MVPYCKTRAGYDESRPRIRIARQQAPYRANHRNEAVVHAATKLTELVWELVSLESKMEQRVNMKFCFKLDKTAK